MTPIPTGRNLTMSQPRVSIRLEAACSLLMGGAVVLVGLAGVEGVTRGLRLSILWAALFLSGSGALIYLNARK